MAPGPLSARVAGLCQEAGHRLGGATQAQVFDVRRRLGECTRIVTQFRYGTSDRVDVVRRNGARSSLPLDEAGMIPQRLGIPRHEIAYVDVTLTSDHLRDLTVVDTPGLASANTAVSAGARRFLFSEAPIDDDLDDDSAGALSGAEAIIYVFTQSVREDDVQALEAFRSMSARLSSNPINSLGLFTSRECRVPREARERLLRLLDLYGISFAIAQLVTRPQLATGELVRTLFQASGFPRLRQTLEQTFRWRTDAIKAGWALSSLEKIASHAERPYDRELLRDAIERVLQQPEYHRLRLLEVAQLVTTGAVDLPEPMEQELTRLALSSDPAWILNLPSATTDQLVRAALEAATRWRAYAVAGASPAQSRVALVAHRGFYLLSQRMRGGPARV